MQRSSSRSSTDCCSVPEPDVVGAGDRDAVRRAHVDAETAEDAQLGREHDVVEAAQAAQPFEAGLVLVVAGLDLAEADAPIGRCRRDRLAGDRVVVAVEPAEARCGARRGPRGVGGDGGAPVSAPWIEAAARRPSAIASIRFRGPRATSPPAQMRGSEVRSDSGSTCTPPGRVRSRSTPASRKLDVGAPGPTARMTVSAGMTVFGAGLERRREAPVGVEHRRHRDRLEPGDRAVSPTNRCGPRRYTIRMPSRSASSISSGSAGISSGDSSATIVTSSTPARRAARATSSVVVIARRASSSERRAERDRRRRRRRRPTRRAARCGPRRTRRCRRRRRRPARRARRGSPGSR